MFEEIAMGVLMAPFWTEAILAFFSYIIDGEIIAVIQRENLSGI